MKVVTWNCNMAFRKKTTKILSFNPDLLVLQECEQPEKVLKEIKPRKLSGFLWFGDNPNKGLAVLSFNGYKIDPAPLYNTTLRHIVPVTVEKGNSTFQLFAIWANNPGDKDGPYVAQVWKAVQYYKELLAAGPCMLIGDFNSNSIWDKEHKGKGHSAVVSALHSLGISSCYHHFTKCSQGAELNPTHYLYRHEDKAYHLDYCFVSDCFLQRLKNVEIGSYNDWRAQSDHVPIFLEFSNRKKQVQQPIHSIFVACSGSQLNPMSKITHAIADYNKEQSPEDAAICNALAAAIDKALPDAENKIWHGHPVWFLDENPVVGYSKMKSTVRLLFWSGQSFDEPALTPEGKFKAAEASYTAAAQINQDDLARWLMKARIIQWDYKNLVKRKGKLERLV